MARMRTLQILITVALIACGGGAKKPDTTTTTTTQSEKSLYDRLGGKDAIVAVVDDFVANVAADKRINAMFQNADIANLKMKLVDQICQATGGPCTYTGKGMKEAHTGMTIRKADFDALVEDLVASLKKFNVPEKEQQELLGLLAPMEKDIVTVQ